MARGPRHEFEMPIIRHVRAPRALHFVDSYQERVSPTRSRLREHLHQTLRRYFEHRAWIGLARPIYGHAADPEVHVVPDLFVRIGGPNAAFPTWKTWEWGAPELAIEIADVDEPPLGITLERYRAIGVREVVWLDVEAEAGYRLRVWDRLKDDLVERVVEDDRTPCVTLGTYWAVGMGEDGPILSMSTEPFYGPVYEKSDHVDADGSPASR